MAFALAWPLALVAASSVALLLLARRRGWIAPGAVIAVAAAGVMGWGLAPGAERLHDLARAAADGARPRALDQGERPIPRGALEAGRWLREHSRPSDLVATSSHCHRMTLDGCDARHFWVAAYTERRVLVEGWSYTTRTTTVQDSAGEAVPFWDSRRLVDNDAAFAHPSGAAVGRLRDRYGVRWLFVDQHNDPAASQLEGFAQLRFRSGDCAVYELVA